MWLAAHIATKCFLRNAPYMEGNYTAAMSQQVQHGTPMGYTPLHILCQNSGKGDTDVHICQKETIRQLILNNIVPVEYFAEQKCPIVSVI